MGAVDKILYQSYFEYLTQKKIEIFLVNFAQNGL